MVKNSSNTWYFIFLSPWRSNNKIDGRTIFLYTCKHLFILCWLTHHYVRMTRILKLLCFIIYIQCFQLMSETYHRVRQYILLPGGSVTWRRRLCWPLTYNDYHDDIRQKSRKYHENTMICVTLYIYPRFLNSKQVCLEIHYHTNTNTKIVYHGWNHFWKLGLNSSYQYFMINFENF